MKELFFMIVLGIGLVLAWTANAIDSMRAESNLQILEQQLAAGCTGDHASPSKEVLTEGAMNLANENIQTITGEIRVLQRDLGKDAFEEQHRALETALADAEAEKKSRLETIVFLEQNPDSSEFDRIRLERLRVAHQSAAQNEKDYRIALEALEKMSEQERLQLQTQQDSQLSDRITRLAELSSRFEKSFVRAKGCHTVAVGNGITLEQAEQIEAARNTGTEIEAASATADRVPAENRDSSKLAGSGASSGSIAQ